MNKIVTRFPPSPTGFQHLGGFRTAIYSWLLAKKYGGEFILRIEDTDRARSVSGASKYIIESLQWLGIDYDIGPSSKDLKEIGEYWDGAPEPKNDYSCVQSQRLPIYAEYAQKLLDLGVAYRCDCTPEMLEQERNEQMARRETPGYSGYCRTRNVSSDSKHVIRLKIPNKLSLSMDDGVRGVISWDNPPLRDPVLLKADKFPTYHLASVVDDHLMGVSHVLRGEEWISTAPIHLLIYDTLGWERPKFCHLSHILGSDGKKLSKRHGAHSLDVYRLQGYLPEAIINFITLIGWNPGEGEQQEIFTKEELIQRFSIEHLSNTSGVFDINKLNWMNGQYIRRLPLNEFIEIGKKYLNGSELNQIANNIKERQQVLNSKEQDSSFDEILNKNYETGFNINSKWDEIAIHVQERLKIMTELPPMVEFLFSDVSYSESDLLAGNDKLIVKNVLEKVKDKLELLSEFNKEILDINIKAVITELNVKNGVVLMPLRIATTGRKITPPLLESICVLGKIDTIRRLNDAINMLS